MEDSPLYPELSMAIIVVLFDITHESVKNFYVKNEWCSV